MKKIVILDIETGGFKAGELAVFAVTPHTGRCQVFHPLPQQLPMTQEAAFVRRTFMAPVFETPYGGKK